jgi:uncharacterized sulfatase
MKQSLIANPLNRREALKCMLAGTAGMALPLGAPASGATGDERPNILMVITDDQSWLHAGAYGDPHIQTPAFDRIAREGVLFEYAFCAVPSCGPCRRSLLTGQSGWRLGSNLTHTPNRGRDPGFQGQPYPNMLQEAGYFIGGVGGKAWRYSKDTWEVPATYPDLQVENRDYAASFVKFLADRPEGTPFHFYFACIEPHRGYSKGSGVRAGRKLSEALVPGWLPDRSEIRSDILDYYLEIEHVDQHLGRMLKTLEEMGELDNTIVVYTSDNGMPFPRAKATLYDSGVRMPLAIMWPREVPGGRTLSDFVGLWDLAPTFLEAAGAAVPQQMYGRSLLPVLRSEKSGQVDPSRDFAVTAKEAHVYARPAGLYPIRSIRTAKWAYIRNYEPDRWPSGPENWPYGDGRSFRFRSEGFNDVGNSPSKSYIMEHRGEPEVAPYFESAFGMRPQDELYDMEADPGQMRNLAGEPAYADVLARLCERMENHLRETGDPRLLPGEMPWAEVYLWDRGPDFWVQFYEEYMKDNTYEENVALLKARFQKEE